MMMVVMMLVVMMLAVMMMAVMMMAVHLLIFLTPSSPSSRQSSLEGRLSHSWKEYILGTGAELEAGIMLEY